MEPTPLRLVVVIASNREGRVGPTVASWFAGQVRERADTDLDVLDVAEVDLPGTLTGAAHRPVAVQDAARRLAAADAFVIVTPEYNHSYPAPVKALIDASRTEWQAKPVGFVSYGGMSGGLRAVEHLRGVFIEMHAVPVRESVSFHSVWDRFGSDGSPLDAGECNAAAKTLLDQLAWFGIALRDARSTRPYGAA